MSFLIGFLTVFMVLDCLVLILLVLMQLPKKEAGAGLAFGGAATDALFGAGSGNFLTKATKYAAIIFFAFAVVLSLLQTQLARRPGSAFLRELEAAQQKKAAAQEQPAASPTRSTAPVPAATAGSTNVVPPAPAGGTNFRLTPLTEPTPTPPAGASTNPAAAPK